MKIAESLPAPGLKITPTGIRLRAQACICPGASGSSAWEGGAALAPCCLWCLVVGDHTGLSVCLSALSWGSCGCQGPRRTSVKSKSRVQKRRRGGCLQGQAGSGNGRDSQGRGPSSMAAWGADLRTRPLKKGRQGQLLGMGDAAVEGSVEPCSRRQPEPAWSKPADTCPGTWPSASSSSSSVTLISLS